LIVLDASVLIALVEAADPHHERAARLLAGHADQEFGISPITLAEFLVGPVRAGRVRAARSAVAALDLQTLDLPDDAGLRLARLRVTSGLRMPDCCVLLAAQVADAAIATFDQRLERAAATLRIGVV